MRKQISLFITANNVPPRVCARGGAKLSKIFQTLAFILQLLAFILQRVTF